MVCMLKYNYPSVDTKVFFSQKGDSLNFKLSFCKLLKHKLSNALQERRMAKFPYNRNSTY